MEALETLLTRCKCGVFLTVNEHRDYYETAAKTIEDAEVRECPPQLEPEVRAKMIETDTIVRLTFYPDTPIGSYDIWHYNVAAALDQALECIPDCAAAIRALKEG